MYLIAGLGNPGLKYRKTPHNAGFLAADALAKNLGARFVKKGNGKVAEARIGAQKVLIVKPQTFMNLSGECIAPLAQYYRIPAEHIVICYDDKDLEPGKLRIRKEGSAGSHNGMKSVILSLGTQAFPRIRMGIGAPRGMRLMDHVLHKLTKRGAGALSENGRGCRGRGRAAGKPGHRGRAAEVQLQGPKRRECICLKGKRAV